MMILDKMSRDHYSDYSTSWGGRECWMATLSVVVETFYPKPHMSASVWHLKTIKVIRLYIIWKQWVLIGEFCPAGGPKTKVNGTPKWFGYIPIWTMNFSIKCWKITKQIFVKMFQSQSIMWVDNLTGRQGHGSNLAPSKLRLMPKRKVNDSYICLF